MDLAHYFSEEYGRQSQLCRAIGAHAADASRWAKGTRPVPIHHCHAIVAATAGRVTFMDLRPDDWWVIWPHLPGAAAAKRAAEEEKVAA